MTTTHREIAFIDRSIADYDVFLANLRPEVEPFVLNSAEDAPQQMAAALCGRSGLAGIHIVAHGQAGEIGFGAGALTAENIAAHNDALACIGSALRDDGNLAMWVCHAAQGERGRAFVESLSRAIGAPVAASASLVGNSASGGSWTLEYGDGRAQAPLAAQGLQTYQGVMTNFIGSVSDDIADATTGTLQGFILGSVSDLQDDIGDAFYPLQGSDKVVAGNGNDTFGFGANELGEGDYIDGRGGNDVLLLDGTANDLSKATILHVERLEATTGSLLFDDQTFSMTAAQFVGFSAIDMFDGTDVLNVMVPGSYDFSAATLPTLTNIEVLNLLGSDGNDAITLTSAQLSVFNMIALSGGSDVLTIKTSGNFSLDNSKLSDVENITLLGDETDQTLTGSSSDEAIEGSGGNDTIDGGEGNDVARYLGARGDFTIERLDSPSGVVWRVIDNAPDTDGNEGVDLLSHVEVLRFNDADFTAANLIGVLSDSNVAENSVVENADIGTAVGITALAVDGDGDAVSYTLADDAGGLFMIDANSGEVKVNGVLDYEAHQSYDITVRATSTDGSISEKVFTIGLSNTDEVAPVFTSGTSAALDENSGAGQVVYTAQSSDAPDEAHPSDGPSLPLVYSLAGHDVDAFTIDPQSGAVTLNADPNYEQKAGYSFDVTVTDAAGNATTQTVALAVNNLDEVAPIFSSGAVAAALAENSGAGQTVYTVAASDASDEAHPNDGPSLPLVYGLSGTDADMFTIDAETGVVKLTADPDFETKANYSFDVSATDTAGNATTQTVSLVVNNLDEVAPVFSSGTAAEALAENSGAGQTVYTATASDAPDEAHPNDGPSLPLVYGLSGSDASAFTIDAATGVVKLTADPDFETKANYSFDVTATDATGNATMQTVTLAIDNLDELAPVFSSGTTAEALAENSGAGQTVYTAAASDAPDEAHPNDGPSLPLVYGLSGTDAGAFTIDAETGVVKLTVDLDFETKANYSFDVVATDAAGNAATKAVTLAVNNLDEVAPVFSSGAVAAALAENSGAGQTVYTATASDAPDEAHPNDGPSLPLVYGLSGSDASAFTIDAATGVVKLTADPDFETKADYSFDVSATDTAGNATTQTVSLVVNNLDEVTPVFSSGTTAKALAENSGAGQIVYTAQASDASDEAHPNDGPSLPLVYGLSGNDAEAFTIDPETGVVKLTADPDFEAKESYSFEVTATDTAGNAAAQTVTLAINNLDEVAPIFSSGVVASALAENSGAGQTVYLAAAIDAPDEAHPNDGPSLPLVFGLSGSDADAFTINAATGVVKLTADTDFETQANYSFDVTATDAAGNAVTQTVTLAINNLDEVAPVFSSGAVAAALAENSGAGQSVYTAVATDASDEVHPNDGPSLPLVYGLSGTDAAAFTIDAETGVVKLTADPNFEAKASYGFNVTLTDGVGNVGVQDVELMINDLNEEPTITSSTTASVVENSPISTVVYTAIASDPDAGQVLAYSLSGSDADLLQINGSSGAVTLKASPDFETRNAYNFTVTATDNGSGALSASQAVTLTVVDVLDEDGDGLLDSEENNVDVNGDGVINSLDTDIDGDGLLNSNDTDDDGDGLTDTAEIGRDSDGDGLSDVFETDDDNDGTATIIESTVPALANSGGTTVPGDGNGDGIADSRQTNVLSRQVLNTPNVSAPGNAAPVYVTLVSDSNAGKASVSGAEASRITAFQQLDAPDDFPSMGETPLGLFSFSATTQAPGATETFSLYIEGSVDVNGYWKKDAAGDWVNLASPANGGSVTQEGGKTRLDFKITDGGQFDSDGVANGVITDPGAPALLQLIGNVINDDNKGHELHGVNGSNDLLLGNNGSDHLYGGSGNNWLVGGNGTDTYHFSPGDLVAGGIDRIVDGNGSLIAFDNALLQQLKLGGASLASLSGGKHVLGRVIDAGNSLALDNGVLIIDVNGDGTFKTGDDFQVRFYNRQIDTLTFNANKDLLTLGGKGPATALPTTGGSQLDTLIGNNKANELNGGDADDQLYGAGGNDKLIGGKGNDVMVGGSGRDLYYWSATDVEANGHDRIIDGKGSRLSFDSALLSQLKLGGQSLSQITAHNVAIDANLNDSNSLAYHDGVLQLDLNGNGSFDNGDFQIEIVGTGTIKGLVFDGALDVVKLI